MAFLYLFFSIEPVGHTNNGAQAGMGTMVLVFVMLGIMGFSTIWMLINIIIMAVRKKWKDIQTRVVLLFSILSVIIQFLLFLT